jgi:hypothetical protein
MAFNGRRREREVASNREEGGGVMIPGPRESGSLTRFTARPEVVHSTPDVTMDAATIADRQREGGGAARERRPVRVPRWRPFMQRLLRMSLPKHLLTSPAAIVVSTSPKMPLDHVC